MQKLFSLYKSFINLANPLQHPLLLLIRLYWGWEFCIAGWGKLHNIEKVTVFFTELGIPFPLFNVYFVSTLEFAGGIFLMVGLASRIVAFLLTCNMTVAFLTADRDALMNIFNNPDAFFAAAPFLFLYASVIILAFGPGCFSVDGILGRWCKKKELNT